MIVYELITDTVPPAKSTDAAGMALTWMSEFKVNQLPIVDEGRYLGMITENEILDAANPEEAIGVIRYPGWDSAYVYQNQHIYDALDVMNNFQLEVLPVLDEEDRYVGAITLRDVSTYLSKLFAVSEPGSILVLSIPKRGYVLSEIGRITESADAKVLSLYLSAVPDAQEVVLTIKLNVEDPSRVIAAFERFQYTILRTYYRSAYGDDLQSNFDSLLRYLNT
ncbi:MAG: CBS domain-containing protein [Bacteroidetes bacterium]|nr:MAG: CBS domain-containing protein [Bacteroidota bacterium]